jgi:RNA polymerase sigma factor (sigma-70 family)
VAVSPTLVSERAPTRARVELDGQPATPAPAVESAGLLYERYYDRIYGYCLYHLGSREEAEDAAQTTFLWAFRGLRRGIVPRAEANWLFTIAQNACRARHRTRGRRREREVLSDPMTLADLSAARRAETDELMGLEDALRRMPELQRRAILLREWRGLSYKEIAEELNLSGAAVETLIFRARRSLAELLGGRPAPKGTRKYALDFGSIAAALKSFLGGGAAVKVAAGLATVIAATTLASGSTERASADPRTTPAPVPATIAPAAQLRSLGEQAGRDAGRAAGPKAEPKAPVNGTSSEPSESRPAAKIVQTVRQTTAEIPVVSDVVAPLPLAEATGAVDDTLDSATEAVAPVTGALP